MGKRGNRSPGGETLSRPAGHKQRQAQQKFYFCPHNPQVMLIQGIFLGISLSFMVGPLLFAILQAGIERGFRAGLAVAAGIWASDVLYVIVVQYGMEALTNLTALPGFRVWAGLAGGMLLVAYGLGSLFFKKTPLPEMSTKKTGELGDRTKPSKEPVDHRKRPYLAWWLRGFLLNTINPFTVFFWLGIASAVVVPNQWNGGQTLTFFGGMMVSLIATDLLKAYAAKRVRRFLTPAHTRWAQWGIGFLLLIFGIVLIVRVLN